MSLPPGVREKIHQVDKNNIRNNYKQLQKSLTLFVACVCQKNKLSKQVHVRMHVYMYVYKYVCLHVLYCRARGPELVQLW